MKWLVYPALILAVATLTTASLAQRSAGNQASPVTSGAQTTAAENSLLDQAEAAIESQDYTKAQSLATKALEANAKDVRGSLRLGFCRAGAGHTDLADTNYRKALDVQPKLPQVQLALGRLFLSQNKADEARKQFLSVTQESAAAGTLQGEAWRALATMDLASDGPECPGRTAARSASFANDARGYAADRAPG